jgi:2-oxoglutarate ferredoxin oxidoreductase subunit alpha
MALTQPLEKDRSINQESSIVNDFSITVGTVNGSGSQTSNLTILRALFKMGIPVSGKNMFPSNIQGLPTWYTIRVSKDGFLARRETTDIMVAMNPASFVQDLESLTPGGAFFYPDDLKLTIDRDDVVQYPMPVKKLVKESDAPRNLQDYVANMVYVGVLTQMLGIDPENIYQALDFHFKGREKPINLNLNLINAASQWAEENLEKKDNYWVEPMNATQDYIMADGNTAAALGAIYGGVHFAAWYPITPATSLAEALVDYLNMLRKDPETGKNTYAVVQAEDELSAIGMTIGAGWGGLRAMTSTSGPGLSLMTEYAGLAYFAEVPIVVWDVQRVGPSTGLPTRTSQSDLNLAHFIGHGDTQNIVLLPGSVNECFEFGWKAFDIADHLQAPIFVLSDLDLGMNQWMTNPFEYPDTPIDRGKIIWEDDFEEIVESWGRYLDIDGDGIPYRTVPGNQHPKSAYFARGTGHDAYAKYTEDPEEYMDLMERLKNKFESARMLVPKPLVYEKDGAKIGVIAFGSTDPAVIEACQILEDEGILCDYLRLRAIPFTQEVEDFITKHDRLYIVEMNRDGQLHQLLILDYSKQSEKLISLAYLDGMPASAIRIADAIRAKEVE